MWPTRRSSPSSVPLGLVSGDYGALGDGRVARWKEPGRSGWAAVGRAHRMVPVLIPLCICLIVM